ncbi:MAG: hypothetical protein D6694_00970, partial [Gammaproteobacteria bacterium]
MVARGRGDVGHEVDPELAPRGHRDLGAVHVDVRVGLGGVGREPHGAVVGRKRDVPGAVERREIDPHHVVVVAAPQPEPVRVLG